jgi:TetR/AcrR family transcriptional regulator, transcriptional repressor for nem operon
MPRNEQKVQTRERILAAAARNFRKGGFGGIGVDGLSKDAGVTSGAFYKHFGSKAEAFRESVVQGVNDVIVGVKHMQTEHGKTWWSKFIKYYLHEKRKCSLTESCGLQSLSADVARADEASRSAFTQELLLVARTIINGPKGSDAPDTIEDAYAALATLVGAVTLARAVNDAAMANKIVLNAEKALLPER